MANWAQIIIVLCVIFLAFLVLREFNCWYFKFNRMVKLLENINDKMKG